VNHADMGDIRMFFEFVLNILSDHYLIVLIDQCYKRDIVDLSHFYLS